MARTSHQSRRTLALVRLAVLVLLLIAVAISLIVIGTDELRDLVERAGNSRWGLIAFIAAYALAVVLLLPGTLATLSAGVMFGFTTGAFAAVAGASLGATAAFYIAKGMGREGAQHLLGSRLENIDRWIGENDFASILVLRLMPIVPFNGLNYAAGLASVRPSRYIAGTVIGLIPGTMLTTGVGDQIDDPTSGAFLLLVALFVGALVGSVIVSKRLRDAEPGSQGSA